MSKILRLGLCHLALAIFTAGGAYAQGTLQNLVQFSGDRGEPEGGLIQGPGGQLYGTAKRGGYGYGSVFRIDPASATPTLTTVYTFTGGLDGLYPTSRLLLASDGNFYGTTTEGGPGAWGTVFRLTPAGTLTTLASFSFGDPNGYDPVAGLVEASDGNFYGTTSSGGVYGLGTVFRVAPSGGVVLVHAFNGVDGGYLNGALVEGSDGALYGTTASGGPGGAQGTIFKLNPASGVVTTLFSFPSYNGPEGSSPYGALVRGSGGVLYGGTFSGGANGGGTVFRITEAGALTTIASLPAGVNSDSGVTRGSDGNFYVLGSYNGNVYKVAPDGTTSVVTTFAAVGGQRARLRSVLLETSSGTFYGVAPSIGSHNRGAVFRLTPASAPVVTILDSFGAVGGANPLALLKASAGGFYGATGSGGTSAYGTVFRLTAGGALTTIRSFAFEDISDLAPPFVILGIGIQGVIEGSDGNLYGTANTNGYGTTGSVFKLTPGGALTTLSGSSNGPPAGAVVEAPDGNLYGMKYGFPHSVFKLTRDGTFTQVASWGNGGLGLPIGRLTLGRDGNFYGMTAYDGPTLLFGRIFKVTPSGVLTTFASFTSANSTPFGRLVAAADGNLYGRTRYDASGTIGTVFRVTPAGVLTTVALVEGSHAGFNFESDLTTGPDGNLYGTTPGTIFRLTPAGALTTLRTFSQSEGAFLGSLVVTGPRELYGVANAGGPLGGGTVFHLTDVAPVLTGSSSAASPLVTAQNTMVSGAVTATDPDDTALAFRIVSQGAKGTAVVNAATGAFTYTPAAGARGRDAFSVVVSDPFGDGNVVTVFVVITPLAPAPRDFDGDGHADMTTYDGAGRWRILKSSSGYMSSTTIDWGGAGYVPVAGDYDGDGAIDPAVYQSTTGQWLALLSSTNYTTVVSQNWGGAAYLPEPGDYDGDGRIDLGVYLRATGQWFVLKSGAGYTTAMTVTTARGTPVPGLDFDGDGTADIAVVHGSIWSIVTSSSGFASVVDVTLGGAAVTLVPGDYDGDGKADPAVYERATGHWRIFQSSSGSILDVTSGGAGFDPVPGDYDGDGLFDVATVERATGNWSAKLSTTGFSTTLNVSGWGASTETLISNAILVIVDDAARADDADADGYADMTVYDPASGQWRTLTSGSNYVTPLNTNWGGAGYTAVPGDYDGDGKADRAVYRAATGDWYVLFSGANFTTSLYVNAGGAGYVPVPGDYDGDGRTDVAVYETTTGLWYVRKSSTNFTTTLAIGWGGTGYTAVPADFDGDGRTDLALYVAATGDWDVLLSSANYTTTLMKNLGGAGYVAMPGDYDGDGKADLVVYNATTGVWYGLKSSTSYTTTINVAWGGTGYAPVRGDFDGDGRADLAVYHASSGTWYVLLSGAGYTTSFSRGWGGGVPLP